MSMLRNTTGILVLALAAGCSVLGNPARSNVPSPPPQDLLQAAQLSRYLSSLQQLVQGSPAEQADAVAGARAQYEASPHGAAQLHYALVLAAPSHPGHDAGAAQLLLREALSRPELLGPAERSLAIVELQRVEDELRLVTETRRLQEQLQQEQDRQASATSSAATARRLQAETEENARLRKALEQARAKLDAIANIERSISDRPSANEGRTP